MKNLFLAAVMSVFMIACTSTVKETPEMDIFTELRSLNTVDEAALSVADKVKHAEYKTQLNEKLQKFLEKDENKTVFTSIEDRKQELVRDIIGLNIQDESTLSPEELENLRSHRTSLIDELQTLLEKGKLFKEIQDLNTIDEASLSPEAKIKHDTYKADLNSRLNTLMNQEENKSSNPDVESRKQEVLEQLTGINNEDERNLTPSELQALRDQRTSLLEELLGLMDGSIVPTPVVPEPQVPEVVEEATPEPAVVPPAEPITPEPTPAPVVAVKPLPARGELFPEILKLNEADEATMTLEQKVEHKALKQDLNRELTEFLSQEENEFFDTVMEQEKNDLRDELIQLNDSDESEITPEQLEQLRDRRSKIVEQLQDMLGNAQRHPAVDYGITSDAKDGIAVKHEKDGNFDVMFTDLLFAFNKTDLKVNVKKTLDKIVQLLQEKPDAIAIISGHSDNIGPVWAKEKIANGRAKNAKKYLINAGIDAFRITATGYSDKQPIAEPFTSANRKKNRRVEVHIKMQDMSSSTSDVVEDTNSADDEEL